MKPKLLQNICRSIITKLQNNFGLTMFKLTFKTISFQIKKNSNYNFVRDISLLIIGGEKKT
jgi:hypothetical protein